MVSPTPLACTELLIARHAPDASTRYRFRSVKPPWPSVGKIARGSLHCRVGRIAAPGNRFRLTVLSVPRRLTVWFSADGQLVNELAASSGVRPVLAAGIRGPCRVARLPAEELTKMPC